MEPNESLIATLKKAGLTDLQAKTYLLLIKSPTPLTATEIAEKLGEKRTNGYALAEKLVAIGLATKDENGSKKQIYSPAHPSAIEQYAEKRRKIVQRQEQEAKSTLPSIINFYNQYQKSPGVSIHFGNEGIDQIYADILEAGQKLYLIRSPADSSENNHQKTMEFVKNRTSKGIPAEIISSNSNHHSPEQHAEWLSEPILSPPPTMIPR